MVHTNLHKIHPDGENKTPVINPIKENGSEPQIPDKILEQLNRIERQLLVMAPPPPATWSTVVNNSKKKTNLSN
jgi:hypothetical protein